MSENIVQVWTNTKMYSRLLQELIFFSENVEKLLFNTGTVEIFGLSNFDLNVITSQG